MARVVLAERKVVPVPRKHRRSWAETRGRVVHIVGRETRNTEGVQLHLRAHDQLAEIKEVLAVPWVVKQWREDGLPQRVAEQATSRPACARMVARDAAGAQLELGGCICCLPSATEMPINQQQRFQSISDRGV